MYRIEHRDGRPLPPHIVAAERRNIVHGGCVVPLGEEFADRVLEDDSYLRWFVVDTEQEGDRRVVVARRTRAQARRDLSVLR